MSSNKEQAEHWSGEEGKHWAQDAARYDAMLAPFAERLGEAAGLAPGECVLDIGCGNGRTTVNAALAVGPTGSILGVDLSPGMLDVARSRAEAEGVSEWARFQVADAQTTELGTDQFDVAMSRFGVMFFDDPVAAFANVAKALRPGGRLAFCCWQGLMENDWILVPGAAVAEHVGFPEAADAEQPGPFSFADPDRVKSVLGDAGFSGVNVEPFETSVLMAGGGSVEDTVQQLISSGMGRALLENAPEPSRSNALEALRAVLEPLHDGDGIRLGGATWVVTAQV